MASAILLTAYSVFIFLAYGTTAAVARLIGAGDEREAAHQAIQSMWLAVGIAVGLVAAGAAFAEPLVRVFGARGAIATNALVYLRISLAGLPALLVTLAGTGYLRGQQNTRTPLIVALTSAAANLVIELVLIYGFGFGIGASALATVLAQTGAASVYIVSVARAVRRLYVPLLPHFASIRRLAAVGRDLLLRTAALRAGLSLATAVATRIGPIDIAAHQVAFEIWSFLGLGLDAVAIAGQAMIGRLLGAGAPAEAKAAGRRMIELGIVLGLVFALLIVVLRPVLPHAFSGDPAVVSLAGFLLWWVAVLQPMNAVVFVLDGVLIGAGDMRFLAWAMVGASLVFAVVLGLVLALDLGIGWLWAGLAVWMVARLVALVARFRSRAWLVTGAGSLRQP